MILAATGHRPDKLGGYGADIEARLRMLAVCALNKLRPTQVISGMALGWDQAIAQAAITLEIPFIAAVPFAGMEKKWPQSSQEKFCAILACATEVVVVTPGGYAPWKLQKRNEWMVDHCDKLVALWDGSHGGTFNCLQYADVKGKPYDNLWDEWRKLNA